MANGGMFAVDLDLRAVDEAFARLSGPIKQSLMRRMGVAGGQAMRDEAKRWVSTSSAPYNPNSSGSQEAGTLRDAIYLADDDRRSTEDRVRYVVSWNNGKAWWGKLEEFGYHRKYKVYFNVKTRTFVTIKSQPLSKPVWVPAKPFLRPAYDVTLPRLNAIMVTTGQRELPILLGELGNG